MECCVREEENSLVFYVVNSEENLTREVAAAETINTEDTITNGEFENQKAHELTRNWGAKKINGQFFREIPEKVH